MHQKHPTILLVDDEAEILKIYSTKLRQLNYEVLTAVNGEEGIQIAKEKKPDLILMDVKMPVVGGVEAATKLKEDPKTRDIKLVFLTAFSGLNKHEAEINVKYAKDLGALDFITKGIGLDEFAQKIESYLQE